MIIVSTGLNRCKILDFIVEVSQTLRDSFVERVDQIFERFRERFAEIIESQAVVLSENVLSVVVVVDVLYAGLFDRTGHCLTNK